MILKEARITKFQSIIDSGAVSIDEHLTALVGQNESGKSAFLKALYHAVPHPPEAGYQVMEDYPRRFLAEYEEVRAERPEIAATLVYQLDDGEIEAINGALDYPLLEDFSLTVEHRYDNSAHPLLNTPEKDYVKHLIHKSGLPFDVSKEVSKVENIVDLMQGLEKFSADPKAKDIALSLHDKFSGLGSGLENTLTQYIWERHLIPRIPVFHYFEDYQLLPAKINLLALQERQVNRKLEQGSRDNADQIFLGLLRLAGVSIDDLAQSKGYEKSKARLENISNTITDRIFHYWEQYKDLEVQFDIREDPDDEAPFNKGPNLYIRVRSSRQRISLPFNQRSKGFILFFSFLVWFDGIRQNAEDSRNIILLLDEPGLNLHATAQFEFMHYINDLSEITQVLYTTHSPFMLQCDKLSRIRMAEERGLDGTRILSLADPGHQASHQTLFPVTAALGFAGIHQSGPPGARLVVESSAEMVLLEFLSGILQQQGKTSLSGEMQIVPVGGFMNWAVLAALVEGPGAALLVLKKNSFQQGDASTALAEHQTPAGPVLTYGAVLEELEGGKSATGSQRGIEDFFPPQQYLEFFNGAFEGELEGKSLQLKDNSGKNPIAQELGKLLAEHDSLRALGPAQRALRVAGTLLSKGYSDNLFDEPTLARFEGLFSKINSLR